MCIRRFGFSCILFLGMVPSFPFKMASLEQTASVWIRIQTLLWGPPVQQAVSGSALKSSADFSIREQNTRPVSCCWVFRAGCSPNWREVGSQKFHCSPSHCRQLDGLPQEKWSSWFEVGALQPAYVLGRAPLLIWKSCLSTDAASQSKCITH